MNRKYFIAFLLLALLLSGCTTFYRYRSDGDLLAANGVKHHAVLYWYGEEGRLWYGAKYAQSDSSVTMRVCKVGPKSFVLEDDLRLVLPSKGNDLRTMKLDAEGKLQPIVPPERLRDGEQPCGEILLNGKPVSTKQLTPAQRPSVVIMCKNTRNPDRYPKTQIYSFGGISRAEASKNARHDPDPCVAP